jgi:photosystem II stability/assembly factor-like uncharacterized protein
MGVGYSGVIVSTRDGGGTWGDMSHGDSASQLIGVNCPSQDQCFAVGDLGVIMATGDAGNTWTAQSSGTSLSVTAVSCPTTNTCFAVTYGAGSAGSILATTNGGNSWTTQLTGLTYGLLGISCPSTSTCFATGGIGKILATTDGGRTWTLQNSGSSEFLWGVSCPSLSTCYTVGEGPVLKTSDGGATWTSTPLGEFFGIDCPNVDTCFAAGGLNIVVTRDGGVTWASLKTGLQGGSLRSITCPTVSNCFATGGSGLDVSRGFVLATGDGRTWTQQNVVTDHFLSGVYCQPNRCHAVGEYSAILAGGGPSAGVGGTGFGLTVATGRGPLLTWTRGTLQSGYFALRVALPGGTVGVLPSDGSLLPAPAQSIQDTSVLSQLAYCYQVVPWGTSSALGHSDRECVVPATGSATGGPKAFTLRMNQGSMATLTWTGPGGQDAYLLEALPLNGSAPRFVPFAGTATRAVDNTGGVPTCYLIAPTLKGSALGQSEMLCGLPGSAALTSQAVASFTRMLAEARAGVRPLTHAGGRAA